MQIIATIVFTEDEKKLHPEIQASLNLQVQTAISRLEQNFSNLEFIEQDRKDVSIADELLEFELELQRLFQRDATIILLAAIAHQCVGVDHTWMSFAVTATVSVGVNSTTTAADVEQLAQKVFHSQAQRKTLHSMGMRVFYTQIKGGND
jgi:hypothetical protein